VKEKKILDIRYYESTPTTPVTLGSKYNFSSDIRPVGARIARKLHEYGFSLGTFDHLYIVFTDILPNNQIKVWPQVFEPWFRYVDYYIFPDKINKMSEEEQLQFVIEATFSALSYLAGSEESKRRLINQAWEDIHRYGTELEILHKQKDTPSYSLKVSYQIQPKGQKSLGWLSYVDKRKQRSGKIPFIELENYQDIFFLVSSMSVSKGYVNLKPRDSFKAEIHNEKYDVPIEIALERVIAA
jgi:hypothetical protein